VTKIKAIKKYCFDCSGGTNKEVTLCPAFDCPLWEYRTGCHVSSGMYKRRIEAAFKNYAADFEEMSREGLDLAGFRAPGRATSSSGSKRRAVATGAWKAEDNPQKGLF
jgi:hypothetical protein